MFEYAILTLKKEILRLNDKEFYMWTDTENKEFDVEISELQKAIDELSGCNVLDSKEESIKEVMEDNFGESTVIDLEKIKFLPSLYHK